MTSVQVLIPDSRFFIPDSRFKPLYSHSFFENVSLLPKLQIYHLIHGSFNTLQRNLIEDRSIIEFDVFAVDQDWIDWNIGSPLKLCVCLYVRNIKKCMGNIEES